MIKMRDVYGIKSGGKWVRDIARDGHPIMGRSVWYFTNYDDCVDYAKRWFGDNFKVQSFGVAA